MSEVAEISNKLYPVFLKPERLHILLVTEAKEGLKKLEWLLSDTLDVNLTVVVTSEGSIDELADFISPYKSVRLFNRPFAEKDLDNKDLVIIATGNPETDRQIQNLATKKAILVNIDDAPGFSDFYLGADFQKGHLRVAINKKLHSPAVAEKVKTLLIHANSYELGEPATLNNNGQSKSQNPHRSEKSWKRIASYSLAAFGFMLLGHLVFSYIPFNAIFEGTVNWGRTLDKTFPIMLLAGFIAQLVDGALGMGYGVTSASILLSAGVNPAAISGSIHTAEMFASGASGYSHYKFRNVNIKLFKALLIPGILGAVSGALLLVLAGEKYGPFIRPVIATYTLLLGIRFIMNAFRDKKPKKKFKQYRLLAGVGGFFDSFAGGGWGPIVTSTLINTGRSHRYVIGSVSLTEFFVTLSSAFTFFTLIGLTHWQTILGLIVGGLIAAPIAARLTGKIPKRTSYALLGVVVIIWSIRILVKLL